MTETVVRSCEQMTLETPVNMKEIRKTEHAATVVTLFAKLDRCHSYHQCPSGEETQ